MSGWMVAALIVYLAFVFAVVFIAWVSVAQLVRLQAAVARHRASAGTWDDDVHLYRAAGFDPPMPGYRPPVERPSEQTFMRGEQFR